MTDLVKIIEDRRARLAAQQAEIVAELARVAEFTRMMAILSEYREGSDDGKETAGSVLRVQILGLAPGGGVRGESTGARTTVVVQRQRGTVTTSDQADPARTGMNAGPMDRSAAGADSFVFTDQTLTRRNE